MQAFSQDSSNVKKDTAVNKKDTNRLFYIKLSGGYNLAALKGNVSGFFNSTMDVYRNMTMSQIDLSLGKGIGIAIKTGWTFHKNISAELGMFYSYGLETQAIRKTDYYSNSIIYTGIDTYTLSARMLYLVPSVAISTSINKFSPYLSAGGMIGWGNIYYNTSWNDPPQGITEWKWRYYKGTATGLQTCIGTAYKLSDHLHALLDISASLVNYAPKRGTLYEYKINGSDSLSTLPVSFKEINFVNKLAFNGNPTPDDQPTQLFIVHYPMSSVNFHLGIKYEF